MAKGQLQTIACKPAFLTAGRALEAVQVNPLRPASKKHCYLSCFPLHTCPATLSSGTAVGRGQHRTPVPLGQAPLVRLEQGIKKKPKKAQPKPTTNQTNSKGLQKNPHDN